MVGVTILDTIEVYGLSGWQFVLGKSPMFICAIICFVSLFKASTKGTIEERSAGVISTEHWGPKNFSGLLPDF